MTDIKRGIALLKYMKEQRKCMFIKNLGMIFHIFIDFHVLCVILAIEQMEIRRQAYEYFKIYTKIHGSHGRLSETGL